jgi:hypothetical protein
MVARFHVAMTTESDGRVEEQVVAESAKCLMESRSWRTAVLQMFLADRKGELPPPWIVADEIVQAWPECKQDI